MTLNPLRTDSAVDLAFDRSIARIVADPAPLTVLFSGGVDSSWLAFALRRHPTIELLTVGTPKSTDLANGRSGAELLQLPWRGAVVGPAEVTAALAECDDLLGGTRRTSRAVAVSLAIAVAQARPSRLVTAQGVDELFLGYAHFHGLTDRALEARYRADLSLLVDREWPRAQRIAARLGRALIAPFLEPDVLVACDAVPLADREPTTEAKPWFRAWAEQRGLPRELAHRPKKALQFGSGIDRLLRSHDAGPGSSREPFPVPNGR